jgi:hypothetical protein
MIFQIRKFNIEIISKMKREREIKKLKLKLDQKDKIELHHFFELKYDSNFK